MEPLHNGCTNKNVMGHKALTYCWAADTDYANEHSMQPHYGLRRRLVFLGGFPNEVLPEVGNRVEVHWCASSEDSKRVE